LCVRFGSILFEELPQLWEILSSHIIPAGETLADPYSTLSITQELADRFHQCNDSLHVLAVITPHVHHDLHEYLLRLVKPCIQCLKCPSSLIRYLASLALTSMGKTLKVPAMIDIIYEALPLVNDSLNDHHRQGSVELIYHLVETLQDDVLPYLVFLIVPLLGRMSDSNEDVRFMSTNVFAQLVKLSPLESGVPNPKEFTQNMIEKKELERKFIGQLIGSEKVAEFSLPVAIKAELRGYQKEGVSWLAFLNRYGLHGILCDGWLHLI
jgi:TATA-binding protein-associated factor